MRADLWGYLLGALDDVDRERVERELAADPQLREELEQVRQRYRRLQAADEPSEPPSYLLDQTCDLVDGVRELEIVGDGSARAAGGPRPWFSACEQEFAVRSGWSRADVLVASGLLLFALMIFFPAIASSRFRARVETCQRNLQRIGYAMVDYSNRHGGTFPAIPTSGNRAVAGIFGPVLREYECLTDDRLLICPGSPLAVRAASYRVPSLAEVDRANGSELIELQRRMGGSYGYSLGYRQNGAYQPPSNRGNCRYALVSDAPSFHLPQGQSQNHAGRGQNVLFEDLRVQFLPEQFSQSLGDSLFRNHLGYVEAGVNENDAVIGSSSARPFTEFN